MIRTIGKSGQISTQRPGCLVGFSLFWIAFSGIFVVIGLTAGAGFFFTAFGLVFVGIGVVLLIYALMSYFARYKVGQPEFRLSQTELRVGDSFAFSFTHTFPRSVQITEMETQLIFRERATYQQGTDTKTVTHEHIIQTFSEPGRQFQAGHLIAKGYQLQIPRTAMHTLKVRRNELTWMVKFTAKIPSLPDFVEEFELNVSPEITRQVSDG